MVINSRLIKAPDRISERPPRGGLSICAQTSRRNILLTVVIGTKLTCGPPQGMSASGGKADVPLGAAATVKIRKLETVVPLGSCGPKRRG
jgi:hypothetical protein